MQSDNQTDDVDKRQPTDVQHDTKAADDAINNNNLNGKFNSTALIKDVIHKKPAEHREVQEKTEVEQRVTADMISGTYTMSVTAKTMTTKTFKPSLDPRERNDIYDDAIEDYKTRVLKAAKLDLPKVDIHKRRELFEKEQKEDANVSTASAASKLGTEIASIKDRISSLQNNLATTTISSTPPKKVDVARTMKLKDRLDCLHQLSIDDPKRNPIEAQFKNVQEAKNEFEMKQQQTAEHQNHNINLHAKLLMNDDNESLESTDREDSGIQTTDVSSSVSQADEQTDHQTDQFQQVIQDKVTKLNVTEPAVAETENTKDEQADIDQHDDESSVSCCEDDHTVLVLDKDAKTPNDAILDFFQSNLLDDHQSYDGDVQIDNYVYECIINRPEHQKNNGLEKSNSALSLCSSSDGQSMYDGDEKIHR